MTYFLHNRIHDYDFLRWLVYTFAGGIICAVFIGMIMFYITVPLTQVISVQTTENATQTGQTPQLQTPSAVNAGNFFGSLLAFFVIPIAVSLGLTSQHPVKHIVPPLFMQAIAYPVLIIVALGRGDANQVFLLFLLALSYPTFVAPIQDKIVTTIVGLSGDSSKMVPYSLKANATADRIFEIINDKRYRDRLRLDTSQTKKLENNHWLLKSPTAASFSTMLELKSDPSDERKTIINTVFYLKMRYSIERTTDLEESAKMRIAYLKDILVSDYLIEVEDRAPILAKSTVKEAEDDIRGIVKSIERIPRGGWYQTITFSTGMIIAIAVALYSGQPGVAAALIVPFAAYLIFDIPRKVKGVE